MPASLFVVDRDTFSNSFFLLSFCMLGVSVIAVRYRYLAARRRSAILKQENSLRQKDTAITLQKGRLQDLDRINDLLLHMIKHHVRSPLSSIVGVLDVVGDDKRKNDLGQIFGLLCSQTINTMALLDSMLLWAESHNQNFRANKCDVSVSNTVDEVLLMLKKQSTDKAIRVRHKPPADTLAHVDPVYLKVTLQNILCSAIDFTPYGGTLELMYVVDSESATLQLCGSRAGISQALLESLNHGNNCAAATSGNEQDHDYEPGMLFTHKFLAINEARCSMESVMGKGAVFSVRFCRRFVHYGGDHAVLQNVS